jgi:hypothetical protein
MFGVQPNASTLAMKDHSRIEPGGRMSRGNVAAFFLKGTPNCGSVSYESAEMPGGSRARSFGVAASLVTVAGCGGGVPLLHPAHVLPGGRVSTGAGVSGQFAFHSGGSRRTPGDPEQAGLEDAVARAALSPGVAPWVGARVGLGARVEGGLVYTGRAVRLDARRAFGREAIAVSIGAGASAVFARATGPDEPGPRPPTDRIAPAGGPELAANGFGFDLPVLVGWRSSASVVQAWAGVRGGVERISGDLPLAPMPGAPPPPAPPPAELVATRWYGGGLVGAAVGLTPFYVVLELDVAYQAVSASARFDGSGGPGPARREGSVTGLTLAPAGAILGKF